MENGETVNLLILDELHRALNRATDAQYELWLLGRALDRVIEMARAARNEEAVTAAELANSLLDAIDIDKIKLKIQDVINSLGELELE